MTTEQLITLVSVILGFAGLVWAAYIRLTGTKKTTDSASTEWQTKLIIDEKNAEIKKLETKLQRERAEKEHFQKLYHDCQEMYFNLSVRLTEAERRGGGKAEGS